MSSGTSIVAAGETFDIGCRVVLWDEPGGLSLYSKTPKYNPRNVDLDTLKSKVNCVVYHHSATYRAKHTHGGLLTRGLSCNFIIDDDDVEGYATIYQCLDVKDAGWSQAPLNNTGVGIEVSWQPGYFANKEFYSAKNQKAYGVPEHEVVEDVIHGQKLKVFAPTDTQVASCIALGWGLCELLGLPAEFPKDPDGNIIKTALKNPGHHRGLLHHFHITKNKIDAAGFPSARVEDEIKARIQYGF